MIWLAMALCFVSLVAAVTVLGWRWMALQVQVGDRQREHELSMKEHDVELQRIYQKSLEPPPPAPVYNTTTVQLDRKSRELLRRSLDSGMEHVYQAVQSNRITETSQFDEAIKKLMREVGATLEVVEAGFGLRDDWGLQARKMQARKIGKGY
jgi:hypothetical protein